LVARLQVALGCAPGRLLRLAFLGRRQVDARTARLRQADRDRLRGRAGAMLALADVLDLLAHELAGLRAGRLALALVALRAFDGFLFGHRAASFLRDVH